MSHQDAADGVLSKSGFSGLGKLTPPALSRVYPNSRLFARLDAGLARPVVWVQGQPGAGKTTLVASFLASKSIDPLWYRLDEGDADPATMFLYLAQAVSGSEQRGPRSLPMLRPEHRSGLPLFARRFFRRFFVDSPRIVVLDDYHEVPAGASLHDLLLCAVEELPAGRSMIVISRAAPPAQLARLRLNGLMEVIAGDALKLTVDEATALAGEHGHQLGPARIAHLVQRTDGWTAGFVLMLEAGSKNHALPDEEDEAVPEVLFDYFAAEILRRLGPHARRLLSAVALMPNTTAAAAAALLGQPEAGAILEDLRRRNCFTTRDVAAEPRYRFHPLFRAFLLADAAEALSTRELISFKIRAAAILDADDQPEPAVPLLAEADAFDELAGLIKRRAAALVETGRNDTLAAWIARLPDLLVGNDGWLSYWRGVGLLFAGSPNVVHDLKRATALFREKEDIVGEYLAWADTAHAIFSDTFGDKARFDPLIAAMSDLQARHPKFPSAGVALRVAIGMYLALFWRSSDRAEIARWKERALVLARAVLGRGHAEVLGYVSVVNDLNDANFADARATLEALPDPRTLEHSPLACGFGLFAHLTAMLYRHEEGDVSAYAEDAIRCLTAIGHLHWLFMAAAFAENDAYRRGDAVASGVWLRRSAEYADRVSPVRGAHYHYAAAQHHTITGDLAVAKAHAERTIEVAEQTGWYFYQAIGRLARTEALAEGKEWEEAKAELDRLDVVLARCAGRSIAFAAALLRAEAGFAREGEAAGIELLARAMALGRSGGYRCPALMPARRARVYSAALKHGIERDFVEVLVRRADLRPPDLDDETWPWPLAVRTFGTFEIRRDGHPLVFSRKTPKRLIMLVKAIAAHGGTAVPEARVIEAIWPDEDGDTGRQSFKIAIHRLRNLLGDPAAVVTARGCVGLDPTRCWLDVRNFDLLSASRVPNETDEAFSARQTRALKLYRGDFLADEEPVWITPQRSRMRGRFSRVACTLAERCSTTGDHQSAGMIYRQALEIAPDSEAICQAFLRHCLAQGCAAEGRDAFERLRSILDGQAGAIPTATSEALYRKLFAM